MDIIDLTISF